ncbi:MCP four helix bundle domain-containing protein, partial [bacterium]|nr:MCP four helix bundle domain-containing protein [bacterium]
MFKNMSLGAKIGVGFGLLILISVLLGALAVYNMKRVEGDSNTLSSEYIPEVDFVVSTERNARRTIQEMSNYAYTGDETYYTAADEWLVRLDERIASLDDLAQSAKHLTQLSGALTKIKDAKSTFVDIRENMKKVIDDIAAINKTLDSSAATFMKE